MEEDFDDQLRDPCQNDNAVETSFTTLQHLHALSRRSKATLVYVLVIWILILIKLHWVAALLFLFAFSLSTVPLFVWWSRIRFNCPLDLVIRSFGAGFALMFWSVYISVVVVFLMVIIRLPIGAFLTNMLAICSQVGSEELHKVMLARWSKRDLDMSRETKTHQIAATATSVGYALGATSFWVMIIIGFEVDVLDATPDGLEGLVLGILAVLIATFFGTPMHVLSGYLIGLEITRQTPFFQVALVPFVLRSLSIMQILLWCISLRQLVPIVLGVVVTDVLICYFMVKHIKRVESTLPVEYLQRVGYLQAFGYGVLPGEEVDEVEIPNNVDVNRLV